VSVAKPDKLIERPIPRHVRKIFALLGAAGLLALPPVAGEEKKNEKLAEPKAIYEELGYTDCSEIKDRNYFHSIYCRCPGGILVECAATAQGAFARDEEPSELGTHMLLPPWFEEKRAEIMAMLDPIRVPEGNIPKDAKKVAAATMTSPEPVDTSAAGVSRRKAEFVGGDKPKQ
jgi:hypothetical protein